MALFFWRISPPEEKPNAQQETTKEWDVSSGKIEIEITLFNQKVKGRFKSWSADLEFNEQDFLGQSGTIQVDVQIASLSLGTVTKQALGPDFFDVARYPVATFTADLETVIDGQMATGTLTIKDRTIPVKTSFHTRKTDGITTAFAYLTLDRQDFGIGDNLPSDKSLGFKVDVTAKLNARRNQIQSP